MSLPISTSKPSGSLSGPSRPNSGWSNLVPMVMVPASASSAIVVPSANSGFSAPSVEGRRLGVGSSRLAAGAPGAPQAASTRSARSPRPAPDESRAVFISVPALDDCARCLPAPVSGQDLGEEVLGALGARGVEELLRGSPPRGSAPSAMKSTRSAALRAKPISWVTTIIVMPSFARPTMTSSTSLIISGSSARGRLVEQHQLGVHRERAGDRDALLLAAGELGGHLRRPGRRRPTRSSSSIARFVAPRPCDSLRTLIGPSVTFSSTVLCAKRLKDWKTMPTSARSSRQRRALGRQRLAVDRDDAGVDGLEPVDRPAQRRFARTGRADDDDDLALRDRGGDVFQHVQLAEVLVDVVENDERIHRLRQSTCPSTNMGRRTRIRDCQVLPERTVSAARTRSRRGRRRRPSRGSSTRRGRRSAPRRRGRRARGIVGQAARLVAEQPRGRARRARRAASGRSSPLMSAASTWHARRLHRGEGRRRSSAPCATGRWKIEPGRRAHDLRVVERRRCDR